LFINKHANRNAFVQGSLVTVYRKPKTHMANSNETRWRRNFMIIDSKTMPDKENRRIQSQTTIASGSKTKRNTQKIHKKLKSYESDFRINHWQSINWLTSCWAHTLELNGCFMGRCQGLALTPQVPRTDRKNCSGLLFIGNPFKWSSFFLGLSSSWTFVFGGNGWKWPWTSVIQYPLARAGRKAKSKVVNWFLRASKRKT